jgi:GT2 family glycosyltransferase
MAEPVAVAIAIVTFNSAADLAGCLEAVATLEPPPREVVVVDCASHDQSVEIAQTFIDRLPLAVHALGENRGFAGGMNAAFAASRSAFFLTLNPDARPRKDYLARLLERAQKDERIGAVTPRLVRPPDQEGLVRLDACGMKLTKAWRHLDRGSGEIDRGQFASAERVFGGTGAATLFRRSALEDVAWADGAIFDPFFHSYREDAELAFRLNERGWQTWYEPQAIAEHRRSVVPENRRKVNPLINYHSLKNRYLLRAYHQTAGNFLRTLPFTLFRDLQALVYVLLFERSSASAFTWLIKNRREIRDRRCHAMGRRTPAAAEVEKFFDKSRINRRE